MKALSWGRGRLLVGLGLASLGCAHMATPSGFVALDDPGAYDYRATTADGLVISAREFDDESEGDLEFWAKAVENEMRYRGGYALLDSRPVQTKRGLAGKQLRFGHDEGSEPHLYFVTLLVGTESSFFFFDDPRLYVLEAGGTKELVEKHAAQLDWAVKEFDPDAL